MRINNGVYLEVTIGWADITLPLKAGTPISAAGAIANNGNAIGIIPVAITHKPLPAFPKTLVLIGGDVDLDEVEAEYGDSLNAAAIAAMSGITFYDDSVPTPGRESAASESTAGLVKQAENVPEAAGDAPTAAEFKALLDAMIGAGQMAEPAESAPAEEEAL